MIKNNTFPWGVYIGDLSDKDETLPLLIDSQKGGFTLLFDNEGEEIANNFIENIALKLFEVISVGNLKVDIFDFSIKKRFLYLSALKNVNLYDVAIHSNEANLKFNELEKIAIHRHYKLLYKKDKKIEK